MSDTRRDVATAGTGAALLATGGVTRHVAVQRAYPNKKPAVHARLLLDKGKKGRKLFAAGSLAGLAGLTPLAVGTTRLARGEVEKKDQKRPLWREGLGGTAEALGGRAEAMTEKVPANVRATQLGVGAGAGLAGSLAARAALGRKGNALKPALTPVAGGLAAAGSLPLTNRAIASKNPDYEATPTGVRRKKKPIVMPSSKSTRYQPGHRRLSQDIGKSQDYLGSRTPHLVQRGAVTAASHPPIVGPLTAAAAAGKYAPPGQERKHAVRQWAMGSGAGVLTGTAGAYGGAALAARSARAERGANKINNTRVGAENWARRKVGMKPASTEPGKLLTRIGQSRAGRPLVGSKARVAGATAGFFGVKALTGAVGGQTAITLNQRDQTRYNRKHGIVGKAAPTTGTKKERRDLANKKRVSAALSAAGGTAGLTSLGLLASGRRGPATTAAIVGSGFGGANALLNTPIQRKEAEAIDVKKAWRLRRQGAGIPKITKGKAVSPDGPPADSRSKNQQLEDALEQLRGTPKRRGDVGKRLEVRNDSKRHSELLARHGDRGPVKTKDRRERMDTWEARYVHHGGPKTEKYRQRAKVGEGVKNVGLGVATVGGAGWLAARSKRGGPIAAKINPKTRHHLDTVAVGGGVAGGAGEIYSGYANNRQSRAANTPGGVAASTLRRMRDYDPEDR